MSVKELTIFDVPLLEEDDAWRRVRATLAAHPLLERIYDEQFLADIIRRRATSEGVLLFWLAQPEDETAVAFWDAVVDDRCRPSKTGKLIDDGKIWSLGLHPQRRTSWSAAH